MEVVDLIVAEHLEPDPGPAARVDFAACVTEIEGDLQEAAVVLEADATRRRS
jgi:hypothetical protein